jgi:hypothetical protein
MSVPNVKSGRVLEFSNGSGVLETEEGEMVPFLAESGKVRPGDMVLCTVREDRDTGADVAELWDESSIQGGHSAEAP